MNDFNVMLREQARTGLQAQLDTAVTNGDAEAARKVTTELEKLAVASAPKAPPYTNVDITAELDKQPWFGIDPRKSAKVVELGKTMDPKKFATAAAFAEALIKAVDEEFKPAPKAGETEGDDEGTDDEDTDDETTPKPKPKNRATDGPSDGDTGSTRNRRTSGPWTKIGDAPADVQKEIKRQADKFVSSTAPKEQREKFITKSLESHYAAHQRKGKK